MKSIRYEMRDAIEDIVKSKDIDRSKFHEVSKFKYEKIIRKLYYSFFDYQKYKDIQMSYMWTRIRQDLSQTDIIYTDWKNWNKYIDKLNDMIADNNSLKMYYLLTDGGWVYEGRFSEIKIVLYEYPMNMDDFYIFPKDYSWLIIHCEDGECMCKVCT